MSVGWETDSTAGATWQKSPSYGETNRSRIYETHFLHPYKTAPGAPGYDENLQSSSIVAASPSCQPLP